MTEAEIRTIIESNLINEGIDEEKSQSITDGIVAELDYNGFFDETGLKISSDEISLEDI